MFSKSKTADMVRLLVDHLDKVLETGERLGGVRFAARPITSAMSADDILAEHARQREFLDGLRALEMTLCARIDKARAWAREMRGRDGNLKLMASLFLTGTQGLADAMEDIADPRQNDFNGGAQVLLFLKTRNVLPDHVVTLDEAPDLASSEAYRIAGRVQLGALLDLCATFIDTLDTHYQLFEPGAATPAVTPEPAIAVPAQLH